MNIYIYKYLHIHKHIHVYVYYVYHTFYSPVQNKTRQSDLSKNWKKKGHQVKTVRFWSLESYQFNDSKAKIPTCGSWLQSSAVITLPLGVKARCFFNETSPKTSNHQGTSLVFLVCCLKQWRQCFLENLRETSGGKNHPAKLIQCNLYTLLIPGSTWDGMAKNPKLINMGTWRIYTPHLLKKNRLKQTILFKVPEG